MVRRSNGVRSAFAPPDFAPYGRVPAPAGTTKGWEPNTPDRGSGGCSRWSVERQHPWWTFGVRIRREGFASDANTIRLSRRRDSRPAWPIPRARPRASGPGPSPRSSSAPHPRRTPGSTPYLGAWKPPILCSSSSASRSGVRSSNIGPMSCTPTGRPSEGRPAGMAVAGRPGMVARPAQTSWSR